MRKKDVDSDNGLKKDDNPGAIQLMHEKRIDLSHNRPQNGDQFISWDIFRIEIFIE